MTTYDSWSLCGKTEWEIMHKRLKGIVISTPKTLRGFVELMHLKTTLIFCHVCCLSAFTTTHYHEYNTVLHGPWPWVTVSFPLFSYATQKHLIGSSTLKIQKSTKSTRHCRKSAPSATALANIPVWGSPIQRLQHCTLFWRVTDSKNYLWHSGRTPDKQQLK